MNKNTLKIIGIAASLIGLGAQLLGEWADDRKLDTEIDEKIDKALAERAKKNDEES